MKSRIDILDIWLDTLNMQEALEKVSEFVEKGRRPHSIFAVNPEKYFCICKDSLLYQAFKSADLLIPDGIGVVLAARLLYGIKLSRVPGVELMTGICDLSARKGYRIFVYGARESVNKKAVEQLCLYNPGLEVVGRSNGYIKQEDMGKLIDRINASGAQILFLALGSPKQEKWLTEHKGSLKNIRVVQGIGGTLDVIAGNVKRAPVIWRKLNLEWLYRLILEPRRLKRQSVLPLFAGMVIFAKLKKAVLFNGRCK